MKHLIFVFVLATLFNLLSCQSVDKKQAVVDLSEEQFNDFVSGLVREDTLAVENLVDKFMTCVQNKQYEQAVSMLYKLDPGTERRQEYGILCFEQMLKAV